MLGRAPGSVDPSRGPAAPPPPPLVGGCYRILAFLDRGGTADIYAARRITTGDEVVVKIATSSSPRPAVRLRREFQLLNALTHEALPRVYDLGELPDGRPYLVMERISGVHAHRWARGLGKAGNPHRTRRAAGLLADACRLVAFLHAHDVLHGDLKPWNMRVSRGGRLRVLDLGGARHLAAPLPWFSPGRFFGTPSFSPPEQHDGADVGFGADLYALGVTAWMLFTSHNPFGTKDAQEARRRQRELEPPRLDALDARFGQELSDLVAELLVKDPRARPRSASAVAERFAALAELEPTERSVAPAADPTMAELRAALSDAACGDCIVATSTQAGVLETMTRQLADHARTLGYEALPVPGERHAAVSGLGGLLDQAQAAALRGPTLVLAPRIDALPSRAQATLAEALARAHHHRRNLVAIVGCVLSRLDRLSPELARRPRLLLRPGHVVPVAASVEVRPRPNADAEACFRRGALAEARSLLTSHRCPSASDVALLAEVLRLEGDLSGALALLRAELARVGLPAARAMLLVAHAKIDLDLHRHQTAGACLAHARALLAGGSWPEWWVQSARRAALVRDPDDALLEGLARAAGDADPADAARLDAWRAALLCERHEYRRAKALVDAACEALAPMGHLPFEAEAAVLRARIYHRFHATADVAPELLGWIEQAPLASLDLARASADDAAEERAGRSPRGLAEIERIAARLLPAERVLVDVMPWVARARSRDTDASDCDEEEDRA